MDASTINLGNCDWRPNFVRMTLDFQADQMPDDSSRTSWHIPKARILSNFCVYMIVSPECKRSATAALWTGGASAARDAYVDVPDGVLYGEKFTYLQPSHAFIEHDNCELDPVLIRVRNGALLYGRGVQDEGQGLADLTLGLSDPSSGGDSGSQLVSQNRREVENDAIGDGIGGSDSSFGPQDIVGDVPDLASRASWFPIPSPCFGVSPYHRGFWGPQNNDRTGETGDRQCREEQKPYGFFHRVFAAFAAIWERFFGDRAAARATPPFNPPSRPRATAAGFLGLIAGGSVLGASPMDSRKTW